MIENHDKAAQVIEFEGLLFGTGYPTDLDGLLEWHDEAYVLFELKSIGTEMRTGQRLALERLADDLGKVKPTVLFLAEHATPIGQDVLAKNAKVTGYRFNGQWKDRLNGMTLYDAMQEFLRFVEEK